MNKTKVAIIGSGNIGTDLMYKIARSDYLEVEAMVGIDRDSEGLKRARKEGIRTFSDGLDSFLSEGSDVSIVFDATTAKAHHKHHQLLSEKGIKLIDLTPAAIGPFVVPTVNLTEHLEKENVNLITCGGQATIPIVYAISQVTSVEYAEIVATVSSVSAGIGTRENIDEFTQTTAKGIEQIGRANKGKAIILLNPADPPIMMRNTIHALVEKKDEQAIINSINEMVASIRTYVPGYRIKGEPIFEGQKVSVFIEVEGAGDYFPPYSGNLDMMTAAAVKVAEEFSKAAKLSV